MNAESAECITQTWSKTQHEKVHNSCLPKLWVT